MSRESSFNRWVDDRNANTAEMIALILSCGYRVFIRPSDSSINSEWCYYTDGTRIGYAQWTYDRTSVGSVHKPSKQVGTGFIVGERITAESLADALACRCPGWAIRDSGHVQKWSDWDTFHNSSEFNRELVEVTK